MSAIPADQIIQTSLIGLGLLVALYTILSERIEDIQKSWVRKSGPKVTKLKSQQDKVIEEWIRNRNNKKLTKELFDIDSNISKIFSSDNYHYDWGYIVSGICFAISLVFSYLFLFVQEILGGKVILLFITTYAEIFLLVGLANFGYIWFKTMFNMRTLFREKRELILEYEESLTEKETKAPKKAKEKKERKKP